MKKFLTLLFFFIAIPFPAQAASYIQISDVAHRQIDGKFINDDLATSLTPDGKLGQLIYNAPRGYKIWSIDAALVDEVMAMANGYKLVNGKSGTGDVVAKDWLMKLKSVTAGSQVVALPYGNPSGYWVHRLIPHNESYYLSAGADHLTKFLNKSVNQSTTYQSLNYFHLTSSQVQSFSDAADAVQATAKYMDSAQLEALQLKIVSIFNPALTSNQRDTLARDLESTSFDVLHKIRLAPGRFTISTHKQDLPITVINDYPNSASLHLAITEMNGRIKAIKGLDVKMDGKSRVQVKIPVEVLTSGSSTLAIGILNENKVQMGDYVLYPITIRTISPIATWLTTIAAVVLFASAVVQSVRRIRKRER